MDSQLVIYITAPNKTVALKIIQILLEKELIFSANLIPIETIVQEYNKISLLVKSIPEKYNIIKQKVKSIYPYSIVCITGVNTQIKHNYSNLVIDSAKIRPS